MAKIHDKFIVELAEVIKGYGNDPNVEDPFMLSLFYRFYELPNIAVSRENFKKMRPIITCSNCARNADNGGLYPDGRTRCPIQEHYALLKDGYCHLAEPWRGEDSYTSVKKYKVVYGRGEEHEQDD